MTMARFLEDCQLPLTRENYLRVAYAGDPPEWSAEAEDDLPPSIRDNSRTFGHKNDPSPSRRSGFPNLTSEQYEDWEQTT